jgi:hypothetical protein
MAGNPYDRAGRIVQGNEKRQAHSGRPVMDKDLLTNILRDAQVIDVDFSVWDQVVTLVVVALEATADAEKSLPVYTLKFLSVHEVNFTFSHHQVKLPFGHFQWNVDEMKLTEENGRFRLEVAGSRYFPKAILEFDDLQIALLDNDALNRRFPGWNEPGAPFVRPGIEAMLDEKPRHTR